MLLLEITKPEKLMLHKTTKPADLAGFDLLVRAHASFSNLTYPIPVFKRKFIVNIFSN